MENLTNFDSSSGGNRSNGTDAKGDSLTWLVGQGKNNCVQVSRPTLHYAPILKFLKIFHLVSG